MQQEDIGNLFRWTIQTGCNNYPFLISILFGLFISLTPSFTLIPWATVYDQKRIIQVVVILLPVCFILIFNQYAHQILSQFLSLPRLARWCMALVCTLGFLSALLAPSPGHAFLELSLFILLAIFSVATAMLIQKYNQAIPATFFVTIVASAFAYQVTFFTSYAGAIILGNPLFLPEPFSGFSNIRFFNQLQIWTLPLVVLPVLLYPRLLTSIRWLIVTLAIGWWVLLFASQSRGSQLAIIIAFTVMLLVFRGEGWRLTKINLLTATAGWILYYFLFSYIPDLETVSRFSTLTEDPARIKLWQTAIDMATENPWLGVGPMHYAYYPNIVATHPHNALLQISAEWGLPATLILLVLIFWGIISWPRRYFKGLSKPLDKNRQLIWVGFFCSLVAGMTYSFVSGVIVMPLSQTMFAAITGMALGLYKQPRTTSASPTLQINLLRLISVMAAAGVLWSLIPEILQQMNTDTPVSITNMQAFGPRFWQLGGIPH